MNIEYLLKYMSMDTYDKILNNTNQYILDLLNDNKREVNLNIRYLIKYGVSNIEKYIYNNLEDLIINHDEFINRINEYENNLSKEEIIMILENN